MRKLLTILATVVIMVIFVPDANAIYDPREVPNNKFGIHMMDENNLDDASLLLNSNGGDWGYVTFVIREDERDTGRWQRIFDDLREHHLIPIIRTASSQGNGFWNIPSEDDVDSWVQFFDSLNWVVENRYIIIGNETNHSTEWGGELDPEGYADYLITFSKALKESNEDYFVLQGGFDASAPNDAKHMSEDRYISRMISHNPNVFEYIDGWSSHSYPNPAFSGNVEDKGRGSVRTYEWEMEYLTSLGVKKDLPIFITETGWAHDIDGNVKAMTSYGGDREKYMDAETISDNYKRAYEEVWTDENVVAVTPFILNYPAEPFGVFSWQKETGEYYDFFYTVQDITKVDGQPKQRNSFEQIWDVEEIPLKGVTNPLGIAYIKNTGQSIWNTEEAIEQDDYIYILTSVFSNRMAPNQKGLYFITKEKPLLSMIVGMNNRVQYQSIFSSI